MRRAAIDELADLPAAAPIPRALGHRVDAETLGHTVLADARARAALQRAAVGAEQALPRLRHRVTVHVDQPAEAVDWLAVVWAKWVAAPVDPRAGVGARARAGGPAGAAGVG